MIGRLALIVVFVLVVYAVVHLLQRRRGPRRAGFSSGVTLITSAGCRLCEPALEALRSYDVDVEVVDLANVPKSAGAVRSLPVAIVTDENGNVAIRRSGRAVITDAEAIASASKLTV